MREKGCGEVREFEKLEVKDIHLKKLTNLDTSREPAYTNIYYNYFKMGSHDYHVRIEKVKTNKWKLTIHLCLTESYSDDILVMSTRACTIKSLKWTTAQVLNNYEYIETCLKDITYKNKLEQIRTNQKV